MLTWAPTVFLPLHAGVPLYCLLQCNLKMAFIHRAPYLQKICFKEVILC